MKKLPQHVAALLAHAYSAAMAYGADPGRAPDYFAATGPLEAELESAYEVVAAAERWRDVPDTAPVNEFDLAENELTAAVDARRRS